MPLISVVDDDASIRQALRRLLESSGYAVETFASAVEYLASSPMGRSACLVLDISMDGMTGFELEEHLAAARAAIPIIFITAFDDDRIRHRAQQAGAAGYLIKPFESSALLGTIQSAVANTR